MTKEQIKQEFNRWIDAERPAIWYKDSKQEWTQVLVTNWRNEDTVYIVDDEQAGLRKLQIDKPDTKFEWFTGQRWRSCGNIPNWDIGTKYRVKSKPKIERRWRYARDEDEYTVATGAYMSDSYVKGSGHFEDDWYKLENDYIDVLIDKKITK